jgi:hypothetical protein
MRHLAINLAVPHEPDLAWLLNKSAAAAGIKSNCGPLIDAANGGWGGGRNDPHEGRCRGYWDQKAGEHRHPFLDAVGRERRLYTRWSMLDEVCGRELAEQHRTILRAAYTEVRFPPQTDGKLGQLFAVAMATAAFREAYSEDEGTCARPNRAKLVESMRLQAGALVEVAVRAWRETEPRARPHFVDEDTERRADAAAKVVDGPARDEEPRTWVTLVRTPCPPCAPRATRPEGALVVGRANRVLWLAGRHPGSEGRMRARGEECWAVEPPRVAPSVESGLVATYVPACDFEFADQPRCA